MTAPIAALLSALLFGISPPLAKILAGEVSPFLLASLLYLGCGLGLLGVLFADRDAAWKALAALSLRMRVRLFCAIAAGGMIAPVLLAFAIQRASAFEVSLFLNFESVATSLLAWLFFKENIGTHFWSGMLVLLLGAVLLSVGSSEGGFSMAGVPVLGACLLWGIDNNLTRDLEDLPAPSLACIKGLVAGGVNMGLALAFGVQAGVGAGSAALWTSFLGLLVLGAVSYGLSLVLFIRSMRGLGAARAGAYFATAPFWGVLLSVVLLGERLSVQQWIATGLMGLGAWVLMRERHEHSHTHEPIVHSHSHAHDEHHQHRHDGGEGPEPHSHTHRHERLTHRHAHFPDVHHRHAHESDDES